MSNELAKFYSTLSHDQRQALEAADTNLQAVFGKDTESTFRKGETLIVAREAVPDRTFSKWCALRWPGHRTYAYPHINVAERLQPYRTRLIDAGVLPSTLLVLGSHPEQVEALLDLYRGSPQPTHQQGKALILGRPVPSGDSGSAGDIGGIAGLRLLHAAKKDCLSDLVDRLERMIREVEDALKSPRLLKGKLVAAILQEARWARAELYNLCAFIEPGAGDRSKPMPVRFLDGCGWAQVVDMLYDLGGEESWPSQSDLRHWLTHRVLPTLLWAARAEGDIRPLASSQATTLQGEPDRPKLAGAYTPAVQDQSGSEHEIDVGPLLQVDGGRRRIRPSPADAERYGEFLVFLREHFQCQGAPESVVEDTVKRVATLIGEIWTQGVLVQGHLVDEFAAQTLAEATYIASLSMPTSSNPPWWNVNPTSHQHPIIL